MCYHFQTCESILSSQKNVKVRAQHDLSGMGAAYPPMYASMFVAILISVIDPKLVVDRIIVAQNGLEG